VGREDKEGEKGRGERGIISPVTWKIRSALLIHRLFHMDKEGSCFRKAGETLYTCRNWIREKSCLPSCSGSRFGVPLFDLQVFLLPGIQWSMQQ